MGTDAPSTDAILDDLQIALERNVPLADLTWYRVGGHAAHLVRVTDIQQIQKLAERCGRLGVALRVLGKGANLLVADGVIDGVVMVLGGETLRRIEIDAERGIVRVGGGADLEKVITSTVRAGLGGAEVLAGIPATIGGAIRMNAGGAFGQIADLVRSASVITSDGSLRTLDQAALGFGYRRSNVGEAIVVEAELALERADDPAALRQRLKEIMAYKKDSQPMAAASAGCAFKNPPREVSLKGAGALIDEAGLKGFRIGGAEVSPRHANFIVVHPGGTATDVLAVMAHVQRTVAERFAVQLEREIVVWGEA